MISFSESTLAPGASLFFTQDLSYVALQAAAELDRHAEGAATTFDATKELASILQQATRSPQDPPAARGRFRSQLTPRMVEVYHQAFAAIGRGSLEDIEELAREAREIASSLENTSEEMSVEAAVSLRDFCLALVENVIGAMDLYEGSRDTDPLPMA